MSATLGEPYLLADYDYPSAKLNQLDHVYAYSSHCIDGEALATVSVQQDSVYLLDLASLHPITSMNLPPSQLCSCASISRIEAGVREPTRTTYIPLTSRSGKRKEYSISRWEQTMSTSSEQLPQERASIKLPWAARHLAFSTGLPRHILAFSVQGDIMVVDQKLSTTANIPAADDSRTYLNTFTFDQSKRRFSQLHETPCAVITVSVFQRENGCEFHVYAISSDGNRVTPIGRPIQRVNGQISNVTVNALGGFSILMDDGLLSHGQLVSDGTQLSVASEVLQTRLRSELFSQKSGFSVLALSDAHLLMAFVSNIGERHLQLLLWDTKFSVVLASSSSPVPPALSNIDPKNMNVSLAYATPENCILSLSPSHDPDKESRMSLHSVLMIVPFLCPSASTVSTAMGCSRQTERWLEPESPSTLQVTDPGERGRSEILKQIESELVANDVPKAEDLFFAWVASEESKSDDNNAVPIIFAKARYGRAKAPAAPKLRPKKDAKSAVLPYNFITQILDLILGSDTPTPKKILEYLLERRLISQGMVAGGVTNRLQEADDWTTIDLAFKCISDLSEDDIASLLWAALTRDSLTVGETISMDVDADARTTAVRQVLSRCLRYSTSESAMRAALKRRFKDFHQLLPVFDILDNWLNRWAERGPLMGFSLESNTPSDNTGKVIRNIEKRTGMPAPEHIIRFLRIILDGFFLQLVQDPTTISVLQNLQEKVLEYIAVQRRLESLRSPLEPFSKLIASTGPESAQQRPNIILPAQPMSLRQYQIEHLVL